MFWDWWQSLFTDMPAYAFFNFKFLPKYGYAVMQGVEYTLILSVVSVLLAVLPALLLATMRLSRCTPVRRVYRGISLDADAGAADYYLLRRVQCDHRAEVYDLGLH